MSFLLWTYVAEMERKSTTPRATVDDGSVKPALEASVTPKDSAVRRVALVVSLYMWMCRN